MPTSFQSLEVRSHKKQGYVVDLKGNLLKIPQNWTLLPPGDPALSRRIKKAHHTWVIKEPKGKKLFSKGILSDAAIIEQLKAELEEERKDPRYEKRLQAGRDRRAKQELAYREEFQVAIFDFLRFHSSYHSLAQALALSITNHAIPVGSGTVARTKTIPLSQRAEAATIAWMRHQTTAYDSMKIERVKGKRREVRKKLASISRAILNKYRGSAPLDNPEHCPLFKAISSLSTVEAP